MGFEISKSTNKQDYEVLIRRRGETEYAAYCPQLNYMISGTEHEEVEGKMNVYIEQYIKELNEEGSN